MELAISRNGTSRPRVPTNDTCKSEALGNIPNHTKLRKPYRTVWIHPYRRPYETIPYVLNCTNRKNRFFESKKSFFVLSLVLDGRCVSDVPVVRYATKNCTNSKNRFFNRDVPVSQYAKSNSYENTRIILIYHLKRVFGKVCLILVPELWKIFPRRYFEFLKVPNYHSEIFKKFSFPHFFSEISPAHAIWAS